MSTNSCSVRTITLPLVVSMRASPPRFLTSAQKSTALSMGFPVLKTITSSEVMARLSQSGKIEPSARVSRIHARICAVLFSLVHVPDPQLMVATFVLGLAFTPIYLRWRNLWPLGVLHGWLGAFCYVWVLDRNPWQEVFG